ncbi:MAG: DUF4167 domain-containing protein [Pseudomonadota bacterium]
MRSSKSRSRNKSNRNRSVGNIVNRVFDSSGPEGKVRGTPQQIIDKYTQLARDAQLSNDRVAAENFQQHAEHYTRLLGEAMREAEARREQQEAQNRERQQNRDNQPNGAASADTDAPRGNVDDPASAPQPDVIDVAAPEESSLVDTPESQPETTKQAERPRKPRRSPKPKTDGSDPVGQAAPETPEAAE